MCVPWEHGTLPPVYPYSYWVGTVVDHFSRKNLGFAVFHKEPSSQETTGFLDRVFQYHGLPDHMISDRGTYFDCEHYRDWCADLGIGYRYGKVGEYGSVAVIERFIKSMKNEGVAFADVSQDEARFREALGACDRLAACRCSNEATRSGNWRCTSCGTMSTAPTSTSAAKHRTRCSMKSKSRRRCSHGLNSVRNGRRCPDVRAQTYRYAGSRESSQSCRLRSWKADGICRSLPSLTQTNWTRPFKPCRVDRVRTADRKATCCVWKLF